MGEPKGIEYFLKRKVGNLKILKDMDNKIDYSGDFKTIEEIDVIISSLYTLFLVSEGTYIFDPEFGIGLYRYVFEPVDIGTKSAIEAEISNAIARYEGRAQITFKVLFFRNRKGFRIDFTISYKGQRKQVKMDIDDSLLKTIQD